MMKNQEHFFKRFPGRKRFANLEEELAEARKSIYRWWYEYLKLSKDYWLFCKLGIHQSADARFEQVWKDFGDIHRVDFDKWWERRGRYLFAEQNLPLKVKELKVDELSISDFGENNLILSVPLTIRRQTIKTQINKILDEYYDINYDVVKNSDANLKLHTGRYRLEAISIAFNVWIENRRLRTLQNPEKQITLWQLGETLRLSDVMKIKPETVVYVRSEKERSMNALTSRYLRRASALIRNAEIGKFPCYDENLLVDPLRFSEKQKRTLLKFEDEWLALNLEYPTF